MNNENVLNNQCPKKLSIIITNYNKGSRIIKLLEQLYNQCTDEIEIIIIDDCSTDNSNKKISAYIKERENFHLHCNKENIGPGLSRNKGLDLCHGEYITFLDGDDEICNNYIEKLLEYTNEECDLFSFEYYINNCVDNEEVEYALNTMLWTKLFRAELFKNVRLGNEYKGLVFGEDVQLLYLYMKNAKKCVKKNDKLVIYNWGIGISNREPAKYEGTVPDEWFVDNEYLFKIE